MSFKIKQRELDEMTDRIGNFCADWEDIVNVLTDYLPLEILDAVCDWDEVNANDIFDEQDLDDLNGLVEVKDSFGCTWSKCECGLFDRIDIDDPSDAEVHASSAYLMTRGPIRLA